MATKALVRVSDMQVVDLMTEQEARETTAAIKADLARAGARLMDMHDREGWRALGYPSFVAYGTAELGKSAKTIYRYLNRELATRPSAGALPAPSCVISDKTPGGILPAAWPAAPRPPGRPLGATDHAPRAVPKPMPTGHHATAALVHWKPPIRALEAAEAALGDTKRLFAPLAAREREECLGYLIGVVEQLQARVDTATALIRAGEDWDNQDVG